MKACIIFWINAQQVRTCQQLIVREACIGIVLA